MQTSIKKQKGFTLVEIAIVLTIIGIVIAAAFPLYDLYSRNMKEDQTEVSIRTALRSVGDFKAVYGRYPCPANPNLEPGDPGYGFEVPNCYPNPAIGSNLIVTDSQNPSLTGPDDDNIIIGVLPFRSLVMQDITSVDGYKNVLTYAVTGTLTEQGLFDENNGGISIVDNSDNDPALANSIINPAHSAHFVVVSHNKDGTGAFNVFGDVVGNVGFPCANTNLIGDQENCDGDAYFRSATESLSFDDEVVYRSGVQISPWQYSSVEQGDIHLRTAMTNGSVLDSIALGSTTLVSTETFSSSAAVEVRDKAGATGADPLSGRVLVTADPLDVTSQGRLLLDNICDASGTNCFSPTLLSGTLADSEGMECTGDTIMTGIQNGAPVCSDELEFLCPANEYFTGFDSNGHLKCGVIPPAACSATPVTTFCGDNVVLSAAGSGEVRTAYSGECYMMNSTAFVAATADANSDGVWSLSELRNYVQVLNENTSRTLTSCNSGTNDALVRDSYLCDNGSFVNQTSQERGYNAASGNWVSDEFSTGAGELAEGGVSPPYSPITANPYTISGDAQFSNDCWCRESMEVISLGCPAGGVGTHYEVRKYLCPQTARINNTSSYEVVFSTGSGPSYCACDTTDHVVNQTCHDHYNSDLGAIPTIANWQVSGNVSTSYAVDCGSGMPVVTGTITAGPSYSCTCPNREDAYYVSTCDAILCDDGMGGFATCPVGTWTSSTTFGPSNYVTSGDGAIIKDGSWSGDINVSDVTGVIRRDWVCPDGKGSSIGADYTKVGNRSGNITMGAFTDSCTCNDTSEVMPAIPCPVGQTGTGVVYERHFLCAQGRFQTPAEYQVPGQLVAEDCRVCTMSPPSSYTPFSLTATLQSDFAVGDTCDCSADDGKSCGQVTGGSLYENIANCQCSP